MRQREGGREIDLCPSLVSYTCIAKNNTSSTGTAVAPEPTAVETELSTALEDLSCSCSNQIIRKHDMRPKESESPRRRIKK